MQERFITPHLIIFNKMHYYYSLLIAMFSLLIISSTTTMAYPYDNYYYPPNNYPPPFSFETPPPPPPASSSPGNNYGSAPPPPPDTYNQDSPPPSDNNYGAPSPPPPDNNYGTPPSPSPPNGNDDDEKTQFLKEHNKARHNISGVAMADLVWNDKLADYALTYAKKRTDCGMVHSEGPYGENIAAGSSKDFSAKEAVDLWVGEKSNYNYSSNKCPGGDQVCGHYTQVVWKNTIRLGCARVGCSNSGIFMICSYDPPGNVGDQKPY